MDWKPMLTRSAHAGDRGQILPIAAMAAVVLIGFAAFAVDTGYWRYQQRVEQVAADSAAMAGADELNYPALNDWKAAARADATTNGFTDDAGVTVSVTVNNPPATGPNSTNAKALEVILTKKQPGFFGRIFGITSQPVSVRAVAALTSNGRNCIYGLGRSGNSVLINGATVSAPQCGIVSDGDLLINGSSVDVGEIGYAGSVINNGSTYPHGGSHPAHALPALDPCPSVAGCAYLKAHPPAGGTCTTPTVYNGLGSATIPPGRYCSTLIVNGVSNVTFSPGVYEFDNGLTLNGSNNVTGNGVTFYNASGQMIVNGTSVNLTAPATGNTAGVLMYQNPSDSNSFIANGTDGVGTGFAGELYFPSADLTINGDLSSWLLLVGNSVTINGSGTNVPSSAFPGFGRAVLAE